MPGLPACSFNVGDCVRRRNAPDAVGVVREVRWSDQTEEWLYRVRFGQQIITVPETDLELLPEDVDPWADIAAGRVEGAATLRKLLTFERLRRPPTRVAASFGVARAKLLPYQFKPLLKFLENPNQRLLVADDVGLGKTVEAGYILKELKARHGLERVLIVVPARLQQKWKDELERRFEESFEIVSRNDLARRFIEPLRRGRDLPDFQWITSYESARAPAISTSLADLQPPLDLVILDEAHRIRNAATQQNALARTLAQCADAMLFLTATPIQTGLENLFELLRLLDPVTFADFNVFQEQLHANRPVLAALAAIRHKPPRVHDALLQLSTLANHPLTAPLTREPFFASVEQRLRDLDVTDRRAVVELQRDISELGPTTHILSRTRKAEVMPDRPERRALAVEVVLTPDERKVYDSVAMFSALINPSAADWGATMALLMAYRQTASCIPAALEYFRERLGDPIDQILDDLDEHLEEEPEGADPPERTSDTASKFWQQVRQVLHTNPGRDSKFEHLRDTLAGVWDDDRAAARPSRKVIVFSYFRRTLGYLSRRLANEGIVTRMIHGGLRVLEREALIDEFLTDPSIRVLLSSEVGSEGLDLQDASVVINYDLPWNPMVVEQRIGRVDRIGQQSKVITIRSLILKDTIEDRILYRLYERVGLFEQAIGEIEPILGERIQELAIAALRGELTPEEQERRADQEADVFLRERQDVARLEREVDQLIAGDQAFLDEVSSLIGDRRVPAPSELFFFAREFLMGRYPGSRIPEDLVAGVADVFLQPQAANDLLTRFPADKDARRVAQKIQQGPFPATLNSDAHLRRPRSELLSMHHPLLRLACLLMEDDAERFHRAFHVSLPATSEAKPGSFLMAVLEFAVSGPRERRELLPVVWNFERGQGLPLDSGRTMLLRILDQAETEEQPPNLSATQLAAACDGLKRYVNDLRGDFVRRERALSAARAARQRASQEATLNARIDAARRRLESLVERGAADFPIRMAQAKLQAEQGRLEQFRSRMDAEASLSVEARDVAIVLVSTRFSVGRASEQKQ